MPDKTLTQNLTRPLSTDRVRDNWLYARTLAQEVDARLSSHDAGLTLSRYPPVALVERRTPLVLAADAGIKTLEYESVLVDTAGMVDLSRSNKEILFTRTGFYQVGAYVQLTGPTTGSGITHNLYLDDKGGVGCQTEISNIDSLLFAAMAVENACRVSSLFLGGEDSGIFTQVGWQGTMSSGATATITYAQMWAYWTREPL